MFPMTEIKCAHCGDNEDLDIDYAEQVDAETGQIKLIATCYKCKGETRITVHASDCDKA